MEKEREHVSAKEIGCLLFAEWAAKACILFPVVLAGLAAGNMVRSIVTGIFLWCAVIGVVLRQAGPGQDFLQSVRARAGRKTAAVVCAAGFWYFLAYTAVFTRLWAEIVREYLTPAIPAPVLCVLPLAAGLVCLWKGLKFRARTGKYTGAVLFLLLALLVCLAGNEVPAGSYRGELTGGVAQSGTVQAGDMTRSQADGTVQSGGVAQGQADGTLQTGEVAQDGTVQSGGIWLAGFAGQPGISHAVGVMDGFLRSAYEVFACMGGMFLPLLLCHPAVARKSRKNSEGAEDVPENENDSAAPARDRTGRVVRLAGCACAAMAGGLCVASGLLLTPRERWLADFPAVEAMRRLCPFGVDAGKCETVLAILLLAGLTMTVAGGLWYVRKTYVWLYTACSEWWKVFLQMLRRHSAEQREALGTPAEGQGLYRAEFAGELSDFPGHGRIRVYGVKTVKRLFGLLDAKKISCYGERISEGLTAVRIWWWIAVLAVYILAAGFSGAFSAIVFFRAYNVQIMVPLMAVFYLAMAAAGKQRASSRSSASFSGQPAAEEARS